MKSNIDIKNETNMTVKLSKQVLRLLISLTLLIILVTACSYNKSFSDEPLNFSGDLLLWATLADVELDLEKVRFNYNEEALKGYLFEDCINKFSPCVTDFDVYIRANDGFMVKISGDTIKDTYLAYIKGQGWTYISDKHPVNSGVKNITDIIIVTNSKSLESRDKLIDGFDPDDCGLNIITDSQNIYYTKGELLILNNKQIIIHDGVSTFEDISIDVLKQKQVVTLSSLIHHEFNKLLVYTFNGEEFYDYDDNGAIEVTSDQINYISNDLKEQKLDIVGIMIDPVGTSVTNNYYDAQYYLGKGLKVISILLDGFSYQQFEAIRMNNSDLFLSKQEDVKKAKTVYKPVTNAGFAAIISGATPLENGVLNRDYRELKVPTIFDFCQENKKSHILVEGDINILNLNTSTLLNLDKDENGYTDNEIMDRVRDIQGENYDYTFVHFHSIDEFGHKYGPMASETMNQIELIDLFIEEIVKDFNGEVIITADHGMHKVDDYGDHGDFRFEDMFVPYMLIDGGKYE